MAEPSHDCGRSSSRSNDSRASPTVRTDHGSGFSDALYAHSRCRSRCGATVWNRQPNLTVSRGASQIR